MFQDPFQNFKKILSSESAVGKQVHFFLISVDTGLVLVLTLGVKAILMIVTVR